MRTVISGPVADEDIENADLMAGIVPTSYVTNDLWEPPLSALPAVVYPIDKKLGMYGEDARDYTLCLHADAVIVAGYNPHLVRVARSLKLPVFQV